MATEVQQNEKTLMQMKKPQEWVYSKINKYKNKQMMESCVCRTRSAVERTNMFYHRLIFA